MDRALQLAERARGHVAPNPLVGCVIVRDGTPVGEGWTAPPPGPHAELTAVEQAGDKAAGATVYTTLEPCAHTGQTGPCADALVTAGVARVVVAVADPNPVAAGGADRLRSAGIPVEFGLREAAAKVGLAPFLHAVRTGRPLVTVKLAMSLDGRIAAADGSSRWITGPGARQAVHRLRASVDAVVVGSGTVLTDDPRLTVRLGPSDAEAGRPRPLRVVLDRRARTNGSARVYDGAAPSLCIVGPDADAEHLVAAGVEVHRLADTEADDGGIGEALAALADRGANAVLVEGGAQIAGAVVSADLADRLVVHVAPLLLGDAGQPALMGLDVATLAAAPRWQIDDVEHVGDDALLTCVAVDAEGAEHAQQAVGSVATELGGGNGAPDLSAAGLGAVGDARPSAG